MTLEPWQVASGTTYSAVHKCAKKPTQIYDVSTGYCKECGEGMQRDDANSCVCKKGYGCENGDTANCTKCIICNADTYQPLNTKAACQGCMLTYQEPDSTRTKCQHRCYVSGVIAFKYYDDKTMSCVACDPNMTVNSENVCVPATGFEEKNGVIQLASISSGLNEAQKASVVIAVFVVILHAVFIAIMLMINAVQKKRWAAMGAKSA